MLDKIKYVFSKEFKEETAYYEFLEKIASKIRLSGNSEDISKKIDRLKNYQSNCSIKVGEYEEPVKNSGVALALVKRD